ncbi:diaminopimelate epimerase [Persicimonas caeni]|uniref:diaminopimelate epimerase n=1 Tax=Persicimonas caeni TaxID=2292766 RepID=UPI001C9A47B5|nr:diaminopimelate epimerase [Persicimonas caeni]
MSRFPPVKSFPIFKYHGLGNDFVVVREADAPDVEAHVEALCDRNRGVGADGVLVLSEFEDAQARMVIFNRDGSRPEMCGNGVRCVVRHLVQVEGFCADALTIVSDAGPRPCRVEEQGAGTWQVAVEMGEAKLDAEPAHVDHDGFTAELVKVDMGNPHAVTFQAAPIETIDAIGELLNAAHPEFPEGVNVEFVEQTGPQAIRVDVYERGVGRTQACGTGACAAAVAAIDAGLCHADAPVEVELPGGVLRIELRDGVVWMTGPVEYVFCGEITDDWLTSQR